MYQYQGIDDTIVGIATATGPGGIGIVRLSGGDAIGIAGKAFRPKNNKEISQCRSHIIHYGHVIDPRQKVDGEYEVIDEVLLSVMRGPKSYTAEDVVEIHCHGGSAAVKAVLETVLDAGARLAEPGEFTKRAFLNGRIDLTQAEAVLDIINAKTGAFLKVSTHQLKGELTAELEVVREDLMRVYTEIEAAVNFSEDDLDARGRAQIAGILNSGLGKIRRLLSSADQGRILKEGIKIVLCGRPNVGKSSLLNALLKTPRAIVSAVEGTTRDTIEETAQIKGVPLQLVDTAGILEPRDLIEEEAVKRSRMYIRGADLVVLMLDASRSLSSEDEKVIDGIEDQKVLVVVNKDDLEPVLREEDIAARLPGRPVVRVSAVKKKGLGALENAVLDLVLKTHSVDPHGLMISNLRHIQALKKCEEHIVESVNLLQRGDVLEVVSDDVKRAVNQLDAVTGKNIDENLIDQIFSSFCIGK